MALDPRHVISEARNLRVQGKTFREIQNILGLKISKATLSYWFKNVILPKDYASRVGELNFKNLQKARAKAATVNRAKREAFSHAIIQINKPIAILIYQKEIAKIALAMLCLGEASKSNPHTNIGFYLGNSNPKIILLFLNLMQQCFEFDIEKVRCTVQCRADQDTEALEKYWQDQTNIPKRLFYKTRIDPRTVGKPTKQSSYKGVLRVDYFDRNIQHELESLSNLVYNYLSNGPVA